MRYRNAGIKVTETFAMRSLRKFGINKAVFYTAGTKLFQAGIQFAVLAVMAKGLSPAEQGYYYTFQSVLALQIFFELGMTGILIQVTSHEAATLDTINVTEISEGLRSQRLSSLLRYLVSWYTKASSLFFICVLASGIVFFMRSKGGLEIRQWIGPWFLSTLMTAFSMIFQAMIAFTEGLGRVSKAAKVRAVFGVSTAITLLLTMYLGAELYSSGVALFVGVFIGIYILAKENGAILSSIWKCNSSLVKISWTKELWGFQWRIALSWISGYLIFQFSTPVVFKLLGSVEAGKYGITQQVGNGISALSMAWATTRQAQWGRWIANGDRMSLDRDFRITLKRTVGVNGVLAGIFMIFMLIGPYWIPRYVDRFASIEVAGILILCGLVNQIIFTEALYLRAHKAEPFLITSLVGAAIMGTGSLVVAHFGIHAVAILYLVSNIAIGLVWGTRIFMREKLKWENLANTQSKFVDSRDKGVS